MSKHYETTLVHCSSLKAFQQYQDSNKDHLSLGYLYMMKTIQN